jgi:hypothetical protein
MAQEEDPQLASPATTVDKLTAGAGTPTTHFSHTLPHRVKSGGDGPIQPVAQPDDDDFDLELALMNLETDGGPPGA